MISRLQTIRIAMFTALAAAGASHGATASPDPPSVVLILADDWDFDELGVYDLAQFPSHTAAHRAGLFPRGRGPRVSNLLFKDARMLTPNIDSLARDGAMLTRFYVTSAVCTPSRYSFLTGRYAGSSPEVEAGADFSIEWGPNLAPDEGNVVRRMKGLGYTTGLVGKWHNSRRVVKHDDPEAYRKSTRLLAERYGFDSVERIHFGNRSPKNLEWLVEGALEFIDRNAQRPFFLLLALPLPHGQFSRAWLNEDPRETVAGRLDEAPQVQPSRRSVHERVTASGIDGANAGATWVDDGVGAILKRLEERSIADNTMVIFTSDHQTRGKFANYEGARVPFLIRWPARIEAGSRVSQLCANIDLLPTLVEAGGGEPASDVAGRSLLPVLAGESSRPWRDALLLEINSSRAVVTPRWKYIANRPAPELRAEMDADAARAKQADRARLIGWGGKATYHAQQSFPHYFDADQLYDLESDVFEQHNLAADPDHAGVLADLRARLVQLLAPLPYTFGELKPAGRVEPGAGADSPAPDGRQVGAQSGS